MDVVGIQRATLAWIVKESDEQQDADRQGVCRISFPSGCQEGVSYQEMFRRIKNTLIMQRKVIRASGRDSGDHMKLSRDKITDISHKLVTTLRKSRELRFKKDANDVRLEIVRAITDLLAVEEKVDRTSRDKIRSQKREIPEGSEEWDLLQKRYYAEELKKFGIDLAR